MLQHPPIVRDNALNTQLFKDGYIVIPFLEEQEIGKLRDIYHEYHADDHIVGLYVSAHAKSWDEMIEISNKMQGIVEPAIDRNFENVQKIGGSFIVKAPDAQNILHPHQDWSIVDEDIHRSFTIWIALQDTDDENGAMYVLPGSHEWVRGYRHVTIPSVYGKIYDLTWQYMHPVHLKAGEAIVFDHALVHASKPNISNTLRIAATYTIISKNATHQICCNNQDVIEVYVCPPDFYIHPESRKGPFNLPKVKNADFTMKQLDGKEFLSYIRKQHIQLSVGSSTSIWDWMRKWMFFWINAHP
jgi:hypothetical protein